MSQQITALPTPINRPSDGHKGTFGRALIVAGSYGMSGAACLAGMGALRGGAGLVDVAVPASILPIVASHEPAYLTVPLPEIEHQLTSDAYLRLQTIIESKNAVGMGPGMGRGRRCDELIRLLYHECPLPMVVDADALNAIAEKPKLLGDHLGPRILTPHPGEFSRLTNLSTEQIQSDRTQHALRFAEQHKVTLILKGAGTVVADSSHYYVNTTGNAGMGTGGTGDVLTGLLTALLASGYDPFAAAQLGVYLHGLAGDIAAAELSQPGMIASDLPDYLPKAWQRFLTGN